MHVLIFFLDLFLASFAQVEPQPEGSEPPARPGSAVAAAVVVVVVVVAVVELGHSGRGRVVAVVDLVDLRVVHTLRRAHAHDHVLDVSGVRVHALGLALGAPERLEAHGELAVALAQLVGAGVAVGGLGLARDCNDGTKEKRNM